MVAGAPPGSVAIAPDGSVAAFVPARRALSWQLTDGAGVPVVRERLWLTMRPGEVRVCGSCHGVNTKDQARRAGDAANTPQALRQLLAYWSANLDDGTAVPPANLTVNRAGTGSGLVASSPVAIACGTTCAAAVGRGTVLTLAASAAAGSRFTGGAAACTGEGTCTIAVSGGPP